MFLTDNDYIVASADAVKILQQCSEEKRITAEDMAIEEISGYLRCRYDTDKIFAAKGSDRNKVIVMYACDVALYHLNSWLPMKMGHEIRKERYERAIKWLNDVQGGKITPDLPTMMGENGEDDVNNTFKWGSQNKQEYIW